MSGFTRIYPNVWRLTAPNGSVMAGRLPPTNTYLVGRSKPVIIDPGPADGAHVKAIVAGLHALGHQPPQAIISTHPHADHDGCAAELAARLNAPVLKFGDQLEDKAAVQVETDVTLVVLHTPGHIHNHICLWLAEQRLLFAGDLVAGQGTVLVIPPDGNMADYLNSLRAMLALKPAAILPGHGPLIEDGPALLQEYIDHRLAREAQVQQWLDAGLTQARDIAAKIYADRPHVLEIATLQIEAHLEKLRG